MMPRSTERSREPADADSRRVIRGRRDMDVPVNADPDLDLEHNMVVRAGAGSGKTTALVERLIALVRSGVPVEHIVAITFTRRAAGELQERFLSGLADAVVRLRRNARDAEGSAGKSAGISPGKSAGKHAGERSGHAQALLLEADRVEQALTSDETPFINTIHAFCARLLRARAFEAGLPPDFEQIDDPEEERLRRSYWRRFIAGAGDAADPDLIVLKEAELPERDLFDFFGELADHPDAVVEHVDPDVGPDLKAITEEAMEFVEGIAALIPEGGEQDSFMAAMEQIRRGVWIRGLDTVVDRADFLDRLTSIPRRKDGFSITLKHWSTDSRSDLYGFARELRDAREELGPKPFARFIDEDVQSALTERRVHLHGSAYRLASRAVDGYREHRLASGLLTYDDLLREAARLMEREEEARAWARRTWPRVLVDEFQDTDPVQARLLFEMLSTGERGGPWQHRTLVPGSLFIVGDDKQSIYRFRRGDFQVFRTCEQSIADQGGRLVTLTANFRSDQKLCGWINGAMRPAFDRDERSVQAGYQDLDPFQGAFADDPVVTPVYLEPDGQTVSTVIRAEARWIANEIERLTGSAVSSPDGGERLLGFGDFMILVRRGKYIPMYVAMLAERGIPVGIGGGDAENAADTLALIDDLLRSVYNPADGVALVATITGPFFGVSDQELLDYRAAGGTFGALLEDLEEMEEPSVGGGGHASFGGLRRARRILTDIRETFDTMAPYAALVHTVTEHGLLAALAARPDGDLAAGILVRLMTDFRDREGKGWNWGECVEEVSGYRSGDLDLDIHSLSTPRSDRARIMTIHQAKGLEADVVFLADPKGPKPRDPVSHVYLADDGYHLALPVSRKEKYRTRILLESPDWDRYSARESLFDAAESRRLLYVACTRARRRLYVSMMHEADSPPYQDLAAPLSACEQAVGPLAPDREERRRRSIDVAAVRERASAMRSRQAAIRESVNGLSRPTWRFIRPSELESADLDESASGRDSADGYGREYGIAVHHLFESLVSRRKSDIPDDFLERDAESVLEAESVRPPSPERLEAAVLAGKGLLASDIWPGIAASERVLTEVPFTVSFERDGVDEVLSGVVDLAFHDGGAWRLIDYKTDRHAPDRIAERYGRQVSAYADAWRAIFPNEPVEAAIWSTEHDLLIPINSSPREA